MPPKFQAGMILDPTDAVYVTRAEDLSFLTGALRVKAWLNISGCRTMGKSSLYVKHSAALAAQGIITLTVDVASEVGQKPNALEWFKELSRAWTGRLALRAPQDAERLQAVILEAFTTLRSDAPVGVVVEHLLLNGLLKQVTGRILLVLDEYDYIGKLPYCDDILFGLRHIQALHAQVALLDRLSICLVGVLSISEFGSAGTPTHVACAEITMRDFESSHNTQRTLMSGFPANRRPQQVVVANVLRLTGGQPYLTIYLLAEVEKRRLNTTAEFRRTYLALLDKSGAMRDLPFFKRIDKDLIKEGSPAFAAVSAYGLLLKRNKEASTEPALSLLVRAGILRAGKTRLQLKGDIFRRRFDARWVERTLGDLSGSPKLHQYRGGTKSAAGKRICIINTGGTLGMVQKGDDVVPMTDEEEFRSYFPALGAVADEVAYFNLFSRDSINVFPNQWIAVAEYIYKRRKEGFAGFVIAHGTDTMAYTASAVAFALGSNLSFPVVFTGAQTTPDVAYGDAHVNLYRACEVAKKDIPEVVISFGNFVYRAVRAQKKDDRRFDGFESPTYPPLAEITGEINVRDELIRKRPDSHSDIELRARFERSVLIVPQFPGLEPSFFEHLLNEDEPHCKGVIVQTLGAGNVTSARPYSFIPFVERASHRGIPVIVTSQYPPDPGAHTKYTPAKAPIEAGAIHAGNMTLAAAVTKFRWVLAELARQRTWRAMAWKARRDLVEHLMVQKPIVGEFNVVEDTYHG